MDSFDDLLSSSRKGLEDNPFSDPFAPRAGSPDPWASPFGQPASHSDDLYTNAFASSSSVDASSDAGTETERSVENSATFEPESPAPAPQEVEDRPDPLDAPSANVEDEEEEDNKPLGRRAIKPTFRPFPQQQPAEPSTPGFRDVSTPVRQPSPPSPPAPSQPPFSEIATIRPTEPEHTTSESKDDSSNEQQHQQSPPPPQQQAQTQPALAHSFANLSLGGAVDGWNTDNNYQEPSSSSAPSYPTPQAPADDDSDDDKPISQIAASRRESMSPKNVPPRRSDEPPVFNITVDDPQKVGTIGGSYTMYTVHTRTTAPQFQKSAFSVLRRYSDFLWLYEVLSNNNPGVVVPPVPEKNALGRFDDAFVRQRRFALEKCVTKMANHPELGKDSDLRLFLESDTFAMDIKHRKAEIAHERGGLMASLGQTLAGPKFHENDEWFERQKGYLDSLEIQLKGLVKAIDLVSRQRADLSAAIGELVQHVGDLAASDVGKQLAQSLSGLVEVEKKSRDLQVIQSEQDMVTLLGTVDEYARMISSVRLAFSSRIRTYYAWKIADADCVRTKQAHEKNKAQGRIATDRMGHSLAQIVDAERRALDARHDFEHCSKLIKSEMARFEKERIEDLKNSLHAFLEGKIERQKDLIASWTNYQQGLLKRSGQTNGTSTVAASAS